MKIAPEKIEHLEGISMGIEKVEREKRVSKDNLLFKDLKWMASELRKAWQELENKDKDVAK